MTNERDDDEDDELATLDPAIEAIAEAILDGAPVDWRTLPQDAAADVLRQLHVLADLADVHRHLTPPAAGSHGAPVPPGTITGMRWGPLTLLENVGRGAFGEVFRAWDARLHREVALKLLYPHIGSGVDDDASIREGRLLARVRHPHVVTVYGADRIDGRVGIWTEFIEGRTLAQLVHERGRLSPEEAAGIGIDVCAALAAVHQAGLVHRDLKAQNVMREEGGRIVLMDFGAGKERLDAGATGNGDRAGTPLYIAPEVWEGAPADVRSDVYSLGVLLFYLATGTHPVVGDSAAAIRNAHRSGRPTPLRVPRPDGPDGFIAAVERALAARPQDRFQTTGDFETALKRVLTPAAVRPSAPPAPGRDRDGRPRSRGAAAMFAALAVLAFAGSRVRLDSSDWISLNRADTASAASVGRQPSAVRKIRLPSHTPDGGRPSRDGRFLAYVDERGDLLVWDAASGQSQRVVERGSSNETIRTPSMSPDGDQVVYGVSVEDGPRDLRVVNVDGSQPHVVIEPSMDVTPVAVDWSWDGQTILCRLLYRDRRGLALGLAPPIALVPAAGGTPRELHSIRGRAPARPSLSPDGRFVVYDAEADPKSSPQRDLFIIPTDGSPPRVLLADLADDLSPRWTADGRSLFFVRPSTTALASVDGWLLPVVDGVAAGPPALVRANLGAAWLLTPTDSGTLVYVVPTISGDIYVASLDLTGESAPGAPVRISPAGVAEHAGPSWSPDGQWIAYLSPARTPAARSAWTMTLHNVRTNETRPLDVQVPVLDNYTPSWVSDARSLIVFGRNQDNSEGYFHVDVATGEATMVVLHDWPWHPFFQGSPDGRDLLYADPRGIVARELASGLERVIVARGARTGMASLGISPDGRAVAFVGRTGPYDNLATSLEVQTIGGRPQVLFSTAAEEQLEFHAWTPDGQSILYTKVSRGTPTVKELFRIAAMGGEPRDMRFAMASQANTPNPITLSPDGRQFAYAQRYAQRDLIVTEKFLPDRTGAPRR